jgi:hypothetical protein
MRTARGRLAGAALAIGLAAGQIANAEVVTLSGDYGYEGFVARELEPGSLIDARGAAFRLANSKNLGPTETANCEQGPLPISPYPLRIYDSPGAVLIGGRFDGEVPQASDWVSTYCNSAAVGVWDSPNASVEGVRARRVWDAVRFSRESELFRVRDVWLSEVRDDCVENDALKSGLIRDVLFDGCFAGISVKRPDWAASDGSGATLTLTGVLMRLQPYLYKGGVKHGALIKADAASPRLVVYDSVFALTDAENVSPQQITIGWDKIGECRNNLLLWMSDRPLPDELAAPPSCFRIARGDQARSLWESARQNWIDCHSAAVRFADDSAPDPLACEGSSYGGQI